MRDERWTGGAERGAWWLAEQLEPQALLSQPGEISGSSAGSVGASVRALCFRNQGACTVLLLQSDTFPPVYSI